MSETKKARAVRAEWISFLFCLLYFTSYVTRKSFAAIKLGLPEGALSDAQIGLIGSALFFAYGAGQLLSGALGDRIDPRKLIFIGLGTTALCNTALPLCIGHAPVWVMAVLWGINGVAQALFWPPLVKLMSIYFKGDSYTRVSMRVVVAAQIALLSVFAMASLAVYLSAWYGIFVVAVLLALVCAVLLLRGFRAMEHSHPGAVRDAMVTAAPRRSRQNETTVAPRDGLWSIIWRTGLLLAFVITAAHGFVRDGIEEWMSTYLYDTYFLTAELSTFMNVIMPLFSMLCVKITTVLYLRIFHDEIKQTVLVSLIAALSAGALALLPAGKWLWFAVLLLMLVVGCVHAANTCLTCYLPRRYEETGRVSMVAGLVNASTYIGSTLAPTAVPLLVERAGWSAVYLVFGGLAALCIGVGIWVCALQRRYWR